MEKFLISKNDCGQRLDKFLVKSFPLLPKSILYKGIRTKKIKVNRKRAEQGQFLCEGDSIEIFLPPKFLEKNSESDFKYLNYDLNIIYEDDNILIVDKKPGVSCVPDEHESVNYLANYIKAYLYKQGSFNPDCDNSFAPSLCNRIDKNTGGIVIAAKNAETLRDINKKIKEHSITKKYLCIVHGIFDKKQDILYAWMIKDSENNIVKVFDEKPDYPNARDMKTGYKVLAENNNLSLLEITLYTGRTHQIRAHMAHIGHPLLGDGKYSKNREDRTKGYKYQALYSYYTKIDNLEFNVSPSKIWFVRELFPDYK